MKKILLLLLVVSILTLSGCGMVNGLGRDFEQFGNWMQRNSD